MSVRSNSNRLSRILFCAGAFAATAVGVYLVGMDSTADPAPLHTAAATVTCQFPPADAETDAARQIGLDETAIRRRIISDDSLGLAIGGTTPAAAEKLAPFRKGLRVAVAGSGASEPLQIEIAFTGPNPSEASGLVDRLAEHFCQQERARLEQPAQAAYLQARNAAAAAEARWITARTELDSLLETHFRELTAEAKRVEAWNNSRLENAPPAEASRFVPAPPVPLRIASPARGPVDNPEWLDLNALIEQRREERSKMLAERTALHPGVQEIDQQIADLEGRLAQVPRTIEADERPIVPEMVSQPDPGGIPPLPPTDRETDLPPVDPSLLDPSGRPTEPSWTATSLESLAANAPIYYKQRQAVRAAQQQYEQLATAARAAWGGRCRVPSIAMTPSVLNQVIAPAEKPRELPMVALVAGLAAALSTAMILPAGSPSTLTTIGQVRERLRVPVLGTLDRSDAGSSESCGGPRNEATASRVLLPLVLVTLCIGGLAIAVVGYCVGW